MDMHLHIQNAFEIIDTYLPDRYVKLVLEKMPKGAVINEDTVRNVRRKSSKRIDVINAMVEVALENKKQIESLKKQIT